MQQLISEKWAEDTPLPGRSFPDYTLGGCPRSFLSRPPAFHPFTCSIPAGCFAPHAHLAIGRQDQSFVFAQWMSCCCTTTVSWPVTMKSLPGDPRPLQQYSAALGRSEDNNSIWSRWSRADFSTKLTSHVWQWEAIEGSDSKAERGVRGNAGSWRERTSDFLCVLWVCTSINVLRMSVTYVPNIRNPKKRRLASDRCIILLVKLKLEKQDSLFYSLRFSTVLAVVLYYYGGDPSSVMFQSWALGSGGGLRQLPAVQKAAIHIQDP